MKFSPLIEKLITDLQILPGVGPRSAQRMAFALLERNRADMQDLSKTIEQASHIGYCAKCRSYCENELCHICADKNRQATRLLCIVENPSDVLAIERTGEYKGTFFVLHGHLSPLDGIGPKELHLDDLDRLLATKDYDEAILATNPTVEGDATAHFISLITKKYGVKASRIARGIPIGGELDNIDGNTLMRSIIGRSQFE